MQNACVSCLTRFNRWPMIIRKSAAQCRSSRFGASSDSVDILPEAFDSLLYCQQAPASFPAAALPLEPRQLARAAFIGSPRLADGLSWRLALHELEPATCKVMLEQAKPDYLLVESTLYSSSRAWPLAGEKQKYAAQMAELAQIARSANVPTVYWYTLNADWLDHFAGALDSFDIIACADPVALEKLGQMGFRPRYLPWAFSPEQYNPLTNFRIAEPQEFLLFDGLSRMIRFEQTRAALKVFEKSGLRIIDTFMLNTPYNIQHLDDASLKNCVSGCVSQTRTQDYYKFAKAYLSIADSSGELTPAQRWRMLEAAACRCPVLHVGSLGEDSAYLAPFVETFSCPQDAFERWQEFRNDPMERERAGHLAWRTVHNQHTFSHCLDKLHGWLGLDKKAISEPLASIVTPSIRPENLERVLKQYEMQTYPNKELIYAFNGNKDDLPVLPENRPDIRAVSVSKEYSTGAVMNVGIRAARGDYIFKLDDDDLYGDHYVADRMIYFREFKIKALGTTRSFYAFKGGDEAYCYEASGPRQDCIGAAFGNIEFSLSNTTGATVAMEREQALALGYQEQAYANADVSYLYKNIFFDPAGACINMDRLNFCVLRGDPKEHTWKASKEEIRRLTGGKPTRINKIFI